MWSSQMVWKCRAWSPNTTLFACAVSLHARIWWIWFSRSLDMEKQNPSAPFSQNVTSLALLWSIEVSAPFHPTPWNEPRVCVAVGATCLFIQTLTRRTLMSINQISSYCSRVTQKKQKTCVWREKVSESVSLEFVLRPLNPILCVYSI